jgi:hypothetical protein
VIATRQRRAGAGTVSLVYYAGHGAANADTKINYLIPVDVANADDEEFWSNSINLNQVIEGLRKLAPEATHYVIFDACRNELNLTSQGKRSLLGRGFLPIDYTPGVMIAYSTAPGKTASDDGVGGGTYARTLAEEIVKPGVEAVTMFRRVALRVNVAIGQDPWVAASTLPEVYLAGLKTEERVSWERVASGDDSAAVAAFIARYPNGEFVVAARELLSHIEHQMKAQETNKELERKRLEDLRIHESALSRQHAALSQPTTSRLLNFGAR